MRQSEFKRKYNHELGRYVKSHIYGEGLWDYAKFIGSKLFGKTSKEIKKEQKKLLKNQQKKLVILLLIKQVIQFSLLSK